MLNIYLYKNVKFNRDYSNVLLKNDDTTLMTYLSTYLEGTITNINKYFSNEKFIDLNILYEGCNYMVIHDSRSNAPYKYFFIDDIYFVSGSAIRYNIILDIWATYSNKITFGYSRLITGHLDALTLAPNYDTTKRKLIYLENGEIQLNTTNTKYFTNKWSTTKNATIIVVASSSGGQHIFISHITDEFQLYSSLRKLTLNKFGIYNEGWTWYTIEINKVYIINSCDLPSIITSAYNDTCLRDVGMGDAEYAGNTWYDFLAFGSYNAGTEEYEAYYNPVVSFNISTQTMFSSETFDTKTDKIKRKYIIGTPFTNQEIAIDSETNYTIKFMIYFIQYNQIMLYFEYGNNRINVTNDFEIPFVNDNYQLYMSQNQAIIDANNKANAVSLMTSLITAGASVALLPLSAGASAMTGIGAIASIANYGVNKIKQQASIESAEKSIDRADGIYTGGLYTLLNGCGLFVYNLKNLKATNDIIKFYGTQFKIYLSTFIPFAPSAFNFCYEQFDDVDINGPFTSDIKTQLENIFKRGVRLWCDSTNYLTNVNYKK